MTSTSISAEAAPMSRSMAPKDTGSTVADALRLMKKAKRVYVAVPTGYDDDWHYFTATKSQLKMHLEFLSKVADRRGKSSPPRITSTAITDYDGKISFYLGSVHSHDEKSCS